MITFSIFCTVAMAQDTTKAENYFYNGQRFFDDKNYKQAIESWEAGYQLSQMPEFKKNLALAYEAIGEYDQAIDALQSYRPHAPYEDQDGLEKWMNELVAKQKEAQEKAEARKKEEAAQQALKEKTKEMEEKARELEEQKKRFEQAAQEQKALEEKKKTLPPQLPMLSAWTATAITAGTAGYFAYQSQQSRTSLSSVCDWDSGFCLNRDDIQSSLDEYQTIRKFGIISTGLAIGFGSIAIWQTKNNLSQTSLSLTPTSISWRMTW